MLRALFLCAALCSTAALAQDDDLPALPTNNKPKPKAPAPRPRARPPPPKPKAPIADDDLPALPSANGTLLVKMSNAVKNAKLSIDDKEIGTLPQPAQSLTAGEHTVSVRRPGYATFTKKVSIMGNKSVDVPVTLEANAAVLSISSDVLGAQIFVNGRFSGTAPVDDVEVPPGKVEVSVKKDGYHDGTQTVAVKAGHDYPIEVKLGAPVAAAVAAQDVPPPVDLTPHDTGLGTATDITSTSASAGSNSGILQQWWFWTAIAVVVVGVAVIATYFGTKSPGSVPLAQHDFMCPSGMCDGWINKPVSAIVPWGQH